MKVYFLVTLFILSNIICIEFPGLKNIEVPTPHIAAKKGDFARTVLMPGDPLRAKFIAETFLENPKLVNNVRGIQGYTGTYKGYPVSVMASGMGMPTIGIYSYELFNGYGVENIIRVGTAGGLQPDLHVKDIVVALSAHTNSNFGEQYKLKGQIAPTASYDLIKRADKVGKEMGIYDSLHFGTILSSDIFYGEKIENVLGFVKLGTLATEMETAALYMNAARAGKNALTVCTISDSLVTGENTSAEVRQTAFKTMMEFSLNIAVSYEKDHPIKN